MDCLQNRNTHRNPQPQQLWAPTTLIKRKTTKHFNQLKFCHIFLRLPFARSPPNVDVSVECADFPAVCPATLRPHTYALPFLTQTTAFRPSVAVTIDLLRRFVSFTPTTADCMLLLMPFAGGCPFSRRQFRLILQHPIFNRSFQMHDECVMHGGFDGQFHTALMGQKS